MSYFPKVITAAEQVDLYNQCNSCSASTEKNALLATFEGAEIDELSGDVTWSETAFLAMYNAAKNIPNATEKSDLLYLIDETIFVGHPHRPPAE